MSKTEDILKKLKIEQLSPMQQQSMLAIGQGGGDVVLLSPTGSGKTLAYLLPLCTQLKAESDAVQAIVVVPGRELAMQSQQVMQRMGTGLRSMSVYGGRPAMDEHRQMKPLKPQVVFGTPGRLNDHLWKGNINAHGVTWLVIDEFDKCLEMGFEDEMTRLLQRLPSLRRRVLLSATDAQQIPSFVRLEGAQRLDFSATNATGQVTLAETVDASRDDTVLAPRVETRVVRSGQKDKLPALDLLLRQIGGEKTIVFLNYRDAVERTADHLRRKGLMPAVFHGGMEQSLREEQLYRFVNGSLNPLVSTDLASRGLDIADVRNIVHYHLPETQQAAVHRTGRTARWQATGRTFFIVAPGEEQQIEALLSGLSTDVITTIKDTNIPAALETANNEWPALPPMVTVYIGKGRRDKVSRGDILGFLCKKGGLEAADIGRIDVYDRHAYAAVRRQQLEPLLQAVKDEKIKGQKTVVEPMR